MRIDLDTFLVTLYVLVDDAYQAHIAAHKPLRRGQPPRLSDSEVLTLAICQQWIGASERAFLRYVDTYWRSYFPVLLDQSAYNRRVRDLAGVLVHLVPLLADELLPALPGYQVLDGIAIPLACCCRGRRHRLFADEAAIGKGGSDRRWYYGVKAVVAVREDGVITGFVVGPASTEERWLYEHLLCWRSDPRRAPWTVAEAPPSHNAGGHVGPTGPIWPVDGAGHVAAPSETLYLGDRGLVGRAWQAHWQQDYQAVIITPDDVPADPWLGRHGHASHRQIIETVNQHLTDDLHLKFPRARTRWGLLARIAAKLAAFNLGIWLNRHFGRPDLALATLFPG
jgi:hypothetical protein